MGPRQRIVAAALAACALLCALTALRPAAAFGSNGQRSIMFDDDELIYSSPQHMAHRLAEMHALGVDVVKASMVWSLVAPRSNASRVPHFDATNPAAYPPGAWDRYDNLVRLSHALGMKVYFMISPLSPTWARAGGQAVQGPPLGRAPIPSLLRKFAQAVGRRYNGAYAAPVPSDEPSAAAIGADPTSQSVRDATAAGTPVPKVDFWGIWNEANERSWLNPWHRRLAGGRTELLQPRLYRGIVDAVWSGLQRTGHRGDTILIGETANKGIIQPIPFVRALYCVSPSLRPLSGEAAALVGCPVRSARAAFVRAHPGLFDATGYAHHPYTFAAPPNVDAGDPNVIALSNLPHFERTIDRIMAAYGRRRPGGVPIYLSEWGYKTRPPNPYVRTNFAQQAAWINEGEYLTWLDPHVNALTQFELVDSPPKPGEPRGSFLYWSSFQTGLILRNGRRKPSYDAYRLPIWVPSAHRGPNVTIWGQLRPADRSASQVGAIEFRPVGAQWKVLRTVQTTSPEGFLLTHVAVPAAGALRLAWYDGRSTRFSRTVTVR